MAEVDLEGDDQEDEPTEEPTEQPDEDDRPDLEDDERAEFDLPDGLAEEIEEEKDADEATEEAEEEAEAGDGGETADQEETTEDQGVGEALEGVSWGDVYVDVLAIFLLEVADQKGSGEVEMGQDDIDALARNGPVNLPEQVDLLAEEMAVDKDLSPAESVTLGTAMICLTVLIKETDVAGEAVSGIGGRLQEARA